MDMSPLRQRMFAKSSADATKPFKPAAKATAEIAASHESPTAGKPIPIFTGGCKLDGEIIWSRLFRNSTNECRADVAVCFGQNVFGRTLDLSQVSMDGGVIYSRGNGANIDPPGPVRFYDGTQTAADPLIVANKGVNNTPAWKGYCYAVLENILLANKFEAIVSDTTTETPTVTNNNCDSRLGDIELVADPSSGLFYGIEDPMTGTSFLVTSDGCGIISRVPIPNYVRLEFAGGGDESLERFYCDSVHPVFCSGLVIIAGYDGFDWESGNPLNLGVMVLVDPSNGDPVGAAWDYTGNVLRSGHYDGPGVMRDSLISSVSPASTDVSYELSYQLPGNANIYCALRFFDRSDNHWDATYPLAPLAGSGNVTGTIWNASSGEVEANEVYMVDPAGYLAVAGEDAPDFGWDLGGCPEVDQIIFMRAPGIVELAGCKTAGGSVTVYRIEQSSSGTSIGMTATITPPAGWTVSGLRYDEQSNLILLSASPPTPASSLIPPRLYRIGPAGSVSFTSLPNTSKLATVRQSLNSPGILVLRNWDGSMMWTHDINGGGGAGTSTLIYDDDAPDDDAFVDLQRNKIRLPLTSGTVTYTAGQISQEDISIIDLITDICVLRGYDEADLSFEGMETLFCRGMRLNASVSVADLLNRIGNLYGFIFAETDGKLKFVRKRTTIGTYTPDVVLTEDDLVEGAQLITAQRNAATKVLTSLGLNWIDPERDFETNDIMAYRTTGIFTGEVSQRDERISLPLIIDPVTARKLLFESFFAQVEAETRFSVTLSPKHLRIEPGSLIELTAGGAERLAMVRRITHRTDDNTLTLEAEAFMAQAAPTIEGPGGDPPPDPEEDVAGLYVHLDLPLMRPNDFVNATTIRQYHGLTTRGFSNWSWADLYSSRNGSVFTKLLDYDLPPMTVAWARNALSQPELLFAMDEESELIIEVRSGDPDDFATVTYTEQMNGATYCAYGRPGRWEIISFQTVTDNLDGTLSLTNLERGLFGTHMVYDQSEQGDGEVHLEGDLVCLLTNLNLVSTRYPSSERNLRERFGIATNTSTIAESSPVWERIYGTSLRPRQPANLKAVHTPGASTLEITWDAVSTIPGNWSDSGAVLPMAETELYGIRLETFAGTFEFETTGRSYSWADYGAELGVNALAHVEVEGVYVWLISPVWGHGYEAFTTGQEA